VKVLKARKREQGWHSDESDCHPPMWLAFNSGPVPYIWVEFVVGSYSEGFYPGSPLSFLHKKQHSKFQFDQDRAPAWADVACSLYNVM